MAALDENLSCMRMRREHLEECTQLVIDSFFQEPMCMALNATRQNLESYFPRRLEEMLTDNISNVIWDSKLHRVAACGFDEVVYPGKPSGPEQAIEWCTDPRILEVYQIFHQLYKDVDIYKKYKVDKYVGIQVGATHPDYRNRGLHLVNALARIKYAQAEGLTLACVVPTGRFSQRVYEKLQFDTLAEVAYEDVRINGEPLPNLEAVGQHKVIRLVARKIDKTLSVIN